jgi:hypothetical protein
MTPALLPFPTATPRLLVTAPQEPVQPTTCTQAVHALWRVGVPVDFDLAATATSVQTSLSSRETRHTELLERAVWGAAGAWEIVRTGPLTPPPGRHKLVLLLHRRALPPWAPSKPITAWEGSDPLALLVEAVAELQPGEQVFLRWAAAPATTHDVQRAWDALPGHPSLTSVLTALVGLPPERLEPKLQQQVEQRLREPLFRVRGVVLLSGEELSRLHSRALPAGSPRACLHGGFWVLRRGQHRAATGRQAPSLPAGSGRTG